MHKINLKGGENGNETSRLLEKKYNTTANGN